MAKMFRCTKPPVFNVMILQECQISQSSSFVLHRSAYTFDLSLQACNLFETCQLKSANAHLIILLVFSEQYVERPSKTPHSQDQEQQGPLDVIQDGLQRIHKGILCWLEHPAAKDNVSTAISNTADLCSISRQLEQWQCLIGKAICRSHLLVVTSAVTLVIIYGQVKSASC